MLFGGTRFHDIVTKSVFVMGSKKSKERSIFVKIWFHDIVTKSGFVMESKKAEEEVFW